MNDANTAQWYENVVMSVMLADAQLTYRLAVRDALAKAGCEDMPRHGSFIVGGVVRNNATVADIVQGLRLTKQAVGQLIDILVAREYLKRSPDPKDRRRMNLELTDRGHYAAEVIHKAIEQVDTELEKQIGSDQIHNLRKSLATLTEMRNGRPVNH